MKLFSSGQTFLDPELDLEVRPPRLRQANNHTAFRCFAVGRIGDMHKAIEHGCLVQRQPFLPARRSSQGRLPNVLFALQWRQIRYPISENWQQCLVHGSKPMSLDVISAHRRNREPPENSPDRLDTRTGFLFNSQIQYR